MSQMFYKPLLIAGPRSGHTLVAME